jgi:hypothetical protein
MRNSAQRKVIKSIVCTCFFCAFAVTASSLATAGDTNAASLMIGEAGAEFIGENIRA